MPTFNDNNAQGWRSWQPENLLGDIAEPPLPTLDNTQSDAQLKAELARLRKQAEQQGFAQGVEQARVEQQALLRQAGEWVSNLKLSLENLDSLIPGRLVQLSLTAVQQLYGSIRVADNHALVTQIRTLMKQDPLLNGTFQLYVSPEEFPAVEQALGETLTAMGWTLHRDAQLAAGGCRVVSPDVEVDASMETRWQALCQLAREELSQ